MVKVSVVVPTFNSEKTIAQCLEGVKNSNYKDYEIIVVDSSENAKTADIARKYTDNIIVLDSKKKRSHSRAEGFKASSGDIIVNIDSDVVIFLDTIEKIVNFFDSHDSFDALTGLLSKEHPNNNFFSQYKNLYMNYIFSRLPKSVNFLYGSIFALRRRVAGEIGTPVNIADDTALGQSLVAKGRKIAFVKDLEVVHLKRYSFSSFIKNDFQIPFDWAIIFLKFKGWKQLGKNNAGFAHASKSQILSLFLAISLFSLFISNNFLNIYYISVLILILLLLWISINFRFLLFLFSEKGLGFTISAVLITFLDHFVMMFGIVSGFIYNSLKRREK